jgi:hypothetical protein
MHSMKDNGQQEEAKVEAQGSDEDAEFELI